LAVASASIQQRTIDADATANYRGRGYKVQAGFGLSSFENKIDALVWDNPKRLTDASGNPSRGRLDLYPDNFVARGKLALEWELAHRTRALTARVARHQAVEPAVDGSGVLRYGDRLLVLPPVEARLAAALSSRFGIVVRRESLAAAGWPDGPPGRNALDVHLVRLRRRLAGVGLTLRTVRSRGYLLEAAATGRPTVEGDPCSS